MGTPEEGVADLGTPLEGGVTTGAGETGELGGVTVGVTGGGSTAIDWPLPTLRLYQHGVPAEHT